jgi:hypothetical protein
MRAPLWASAPDKCAAPKTIALWGGVKRTGLMSWAPGPLKARAAAYRERVRRPSLRA